MSDVKNKVTLYCTEGGSDKQYTVWIEEKDGGWIVPFNYGPRGGWVQAKVKTPGPLSFEEAKKVYDKVIKGQRAKGYVEGQDAPAFSQTENAVDSGLRPMLLTPDDEANAEQYLTNDDWCAQEKMNGKRIMLRIKGKSVTGVNRRGLECPIPTALQKAFGGLAVPYDLDGELIGETYHVFDVLSEGGGDYGAKNVYGTRIVGAEYLVSTVNNKLVRLVPAIVGTPNKRDLYEKLKSGRKEGIVFKKLHGFYAPGKVETVSKSFAVKVKFYTEGSFLVLDWNKGTSSVQVAALDGKKPVSVGNVTVAAKYADQISKGDVVRVKYLYATSGDQLYQPSLDATDAGHVVADGPADKLSSLKHEGKDE